MRHLMIGFSTLTLLVLLQQAEWIASFVPSNIRYGCICRMDECRSGSMWYVKGNHNNNDRRKMKTVTFMGVRSFISKRVNKIGKRKKNEDNEDCIDDEVVDLDNVNNDMEQIVMKEDVININDNNMDTGMGDRNEDSISNNSDKNIINDDSNLENNKTHNNNNSNLISSIDNSETIFERIERMKSGGLTNEEKERFLNTALTRTSSVVENNRTGPPIRQTIPVNLKNSPAISPSSSSSSSSASSPSPFPKDSLWNSVIGAGTEKTQEILKKSLNVEDDQINIYTDSDQMDESQKRAWFEMITSPTRFASFSGSQVSKGVAAINDINNDSNVKDGDNLDVDVDKKDTNINMNSNDQKSTIQQSINAFTSKSKSNSETKADLASRLEKAAILQEKKAADARMKREEERIASKQKEMEQQEQLERFKKQQEEELMKQEQEMMARKKEEEIRMKQLEEERMNVERERMKQLEKAQEEYWKNKIEQERKLKLKGKDEADAVLTTAEENKLEEENDQDKQDDNDNDLIKNEDIIKAEPKIESQEKKNIETDKNDLTPTPNVSINKKVSSSKKDNTFLDELDKAKNKLDAMLDEQLMQLSQLNSPLPSPVKPKAGVIPIMSTAQNLKSPSSRPTKASFSSTPPSILPKANTNLSTKITDNQPSSTKLPFNGWGSLGRKETVDLNFKPSTKSTEPSLPPPSTTSPLSSNSQENKSNSKSNTVPRLSLKEMTKYKGNDLKSSNSSQSPSPQPPLAQRKGPIRQQISFDDDDDDGDDDDNDSVSNKPIRNEMSKKSNLEIPIDQQEKANKWGINLDLLK